MENNIPYNWHMEIDPISLPWKSVYKILIGSIVPRPIGWISSLDPAGRANLAPFSFFNVVCANPPHILFCPMIRSTDRQPKDTLRNVRSTGEFVANIVTEELAQAMNLTATELPAKINEFEISGLTPMPSVSVKPPRVAESPVQFECKVATIFDFGDQPGSGSVVIGRVTHIHVGDDVLMEGNKINLNKLRPIGRLAGNDYCRVTDLLQMIRPPSAIQPPPSY